MQIFFLIIQIMICPNMQCNPPSLPCITCQLISWHLRWLLGVKCIPHATHSRFNKLSRAGTVTLLTPARILGIRINWLLYRYNDKTSDLFGWELVLGFWVFFLAREVSSSFINPTPLDLCNSRLNFAKASVGHGQPLACILVTPPTHTVFFFQGLKSFKNISFCI